MPTYAQASDVARVLGLDITFSTTTKPTLAQVNDFIDEAEAWIEDETGHAWKEKKRDWWEEHELGRLGVRQSWFTWRGYPIYLNHRRVKPFNAALGDKFEVLEAVDNWVSWINDTDKYELDTDYGIVYIKRFFLGARRGFLARFQYRYGETVVPADIRLATAKLAAVWLIQSNDQWDLLPGGASNIVVAREKSEVFRKEVDDILARYLELASPH